MTEKTTKFGVACLLAAIGLIYYNTIAGANDQRWDSLPETWNTLEHCLILSVLVERVTFALTYLLPSKRARENQATAGQAAGGADTSIVVSDESGMRGLRLIFAGALSFLAAVGTGNIVNTLVKHTQPESGLALFFQTLLSGIFILGLSLFFHEVMNTIQAVLKGVARKYETR